MWFPSASCPPVITLRASSRGAPAAAEPLRRPQSWCDDRADHFRGDGIGSIPQQTHTHTHTHRHLSSLSPSFSLSHSLSLLITSGVLRASECEKPPWRSHQGSNQRVNAKCALLLRCDDGGKGVERARLVREGKKKILCICKLEQKT